MGVTFHLIEDEGIDCGSIVAQALWEICDDTTAWDLYQESIRQGEALLDTALDSLLDRGVTPSPQDGRWSTYHPPGQIDFSDLAIRWQMPAKALSAWTRARIFPPLQMPYFVWRGERIEIARCRVAQGGRSPAGTLLSVSPLVVAAGRGAIELMELRSHCETVSGTEWAMREGLCEGAVLSESAG